MALKIRQARYAIGDALYVKTSEGLVATVIEFDGRTNLALVATITGEQWVSLRTLDPSSELAALQC